MPSPANRLRPALRALGLSLLAGTVVSLGRPGLECVVLQFLATLIWLSWVIRQPTFGGALAAGIGHGIGLFATTCLGAVSWGYHVVATFVAFGTLFYSLPLAGWVFWAARRLSTPMLFAGTAALIALLMDASDWLYSPRVGTQALVRVAPWWMGGARLVGANLLEGVLTASLVTAALQLANPQRLRQTAARVSLPLAAGAALLASLSIIARASAGPAHKTLTAGIPQLNIPTNYYIARMGSPDATRRLQQRLNQQLTALSGADLIVFSESYDERYSLLFPGVRQQFARFARASKQALLVSSYLVDARGDRTNSLGLFAKTGTLVGIHEKVDLALFGEDEVSAGSGYRALPLDQKISVGVMICNEAALPNAGRALVADGADLLAVSTDDGSFGDTVVVFEHIAAAQLRAIELGRDLIWASNRGPSGLMNRFGAFEPTTVLGAAQPISVSASAYAGRTPYTRTNELWVGLELLVLLGTWMARRRPSEPRSVSATRAVVRPLIAGLTAACLTAALSPALVRVNYGNQAAAWQAIAETLAPDPPIGEPGGYARFTTNSDTTLRGALAYLLSYYGPDIEAKALPEPPEAAATADEIGQYLRWRFGVNTRTVDLRQRAPTAAALVQRRDGKYGVIATSKGSTFFFFPENGQSGTLPFAALKPKLRTWALVLAPDDTLRAINR